MTPQQRSTLKSVVLASQNAEIQAAASTRNDTELARLLNLPSTFAVWRIDVPSTELVGAIKLANFTPIDAPDDTLLYNNRCALCELKQNNIRLLLAREVITSQKLATRQDLTDALTNVPAGAGGAAIDAGWLGAGKVKATITRFATVAESAFADGTGTTGQPGNLGWEGEVTINDIGQMCGTTEMANEAYIRKGTSKLVNGEAGADAAWSMEGVANAAGRVSAQIDWGAAPRPAEYSWSCEVMWRATPTQGGVLELYVAGAPDADSTQIDGDVGSSDAALGDVDMRRNLRYIGAVVSENATASEKCVASGRFTFTERYMTIVGYNGAGATINATDSNFRFDIVPVYWQAQ